MEPIPLNPEDWHAVMQSAVITTGHGDEVMVVLESAMDSWKVTVHPVPTVKTNALDVQPDTL